MWIALTPPSRAVFPEPLPDCSFPKTHPADGVSGKCGGLEQRRSEPAARTHFRPFAPASTLPRTGHLFIGGEVRALPARQEEGVAVRVLEIGVRDRLPLRRPEELDALREQPSYSYWTSSQPNEPLKKVPIRSSCPGGVKSSNPVCAPGMASSIHRLSPIGRSVVMTNPMTSVQKASARSWSRVGTPT